MTVLDRSWKNCLRMWKWISENLPVGFSAFDWEIKERTIDGLKTKWLKDNKFTNAMAADCFFCEYDRRRKDSCKSCPASLVEAGFHCDEDSLSFRLDPKEFYIRLLELNIKRLETK